MALIIYARPRHCANIKSLIAQNVFRFQYNEDDEFLNYITK